MKSGFLAGEAHKFVGIQQYVFHSTATPQSELVKLTMSGR